jgi:hypothetical protein
VRKYKKNSLPAQKKSVQDNAVHKGPGDREQKGLKLTIFNFKERQEEKKSGAQASPPPIFRLNCPGSLTNRYTMPAVEITETAPAAACEPVRATARPFEQITFQLNVTHVSAVSASGEDRGCLRRTS